MIGYLTSPLSFIEIPRVEFEFKFVIDFQDGCIGGHIVFQINLKNNNTWSGLATEHPHQISLKSLQ